MNRPPLPEAAWTHARPLLPDDRRGPEPSRGPGICQALRVNAWFVTVLGSLACGGGSAVEEPVASAPEFAGKPTAAPVESQEARRRRESVERQLTALVREQDDPEFFTIEDRLRHYRVPGASVAVIHQGRIEWASGYGFRSMSTLDPVTPGTLFQVGSVSKPVAALGVMMLAESGVVHLDEDVNEQLRSWRIPETPRRGGAVITPRMLLGHRGGLTMPGVPGWFFDEEAALLVETLRGDPIDHASVWRREEWKSITYPPVEVAYAPGREWRYSGGGYCALQLLVEDLTGRSFDAVMRERVFDPLEMTRSSFVPWSTRERPDDVADGHLELGEVVAGGSQRLPCVTAAGLWTTARELAAVFIEVQRATRDHSALFSRAMVHAMIEPGDPAPPLFEAYGLGFVLEGIEDYARFGHHGSNGFYQALAVMFRDRGEGAVVLTNGWRGFPLAEEILNSIAREYQWPGYGTSRRTRLSHEALARYEGVYVLDLGGEKRPTTVAFEDHELHLRIEGDDEHILYPVYPPEAGSFFLLREGHARPVRFEDASGAIAGFTLKMGPRVLRGSRAAARPAGPMR